MKKIVLIDGNNLMFRSYYATAYNNNMMKNSKDFPTNALFGFTSMINKIVNEEKPIYMAVAFDIGINFRKQEFNFYKEGRNKTPDELHIQMPIAKQLLDAMGIKHLELEPYEADDIIGTLVKMCEDDKNFDATIVSSDKDLLQLINYETDYKLLKQTGYIRYNESSFKEEYGIHPIKVIDLKGLMGDSSDNIPGVKGIGEKTALKLLNEYGSLEGIYDNIDKIKGSVHDKLISDKENAFMSKKIATIYKDVPLNINLDDLKYDGPNILKLKEMYTELEFNTFLKNMNAPEEKEEIHYINVDDSINVVLEDKISLYIEASDLVYTKASILGAAVCDNKYIYYFDKTNINRLQKVLENKTITTFDHKKNMYLLNNNIIAKDDLLIGAYLLEYNIKDDFAYLANIMGNEIPYYQNILKDDFNLANTICTKCKLIYKYNDIIFNKLKDNDLLDLYNNIEMPLIPVLSKMEIEGIIVDKNILISQGENISLRLDALTSEIYTLAGEEFNINSPKQLGEILFEKLEITKGKKNKTGYKTDVDTLEKISDMHPIIKKILEYRNLAKLKSTYIEGLQNTIHDDNKIHTIYKQTIARTGRLSSIEPNLQNIPVKEELGRKIREAFLPKNDYLLSLDYSQIELRVLSHVANVPSMIEIFNNDGDIHTRVAADINGVDIKDVTKTMRSNAKSVIFGIVYGISGFGLGENLKISKKEADYFINKYYDLYPEVKKYMNDQITFVKENGYVKTLYGRKRTIDEINNPNFMIRQTGERMAINTPIQGTAADIIKKAMINIDYRFYKENIRSKMILQIHDELIFDIVEEETDKVLQIVKYEMENVIKLSVPLKVSSGIGKNLYEAK